MKKSLLIGAFAVLSATSAFAVTDGSTYPKVNGITCENRWVYSRNAGNWNQLPFAEMYAKARVSCLYDAEATDKYTAGTKVLVGWSQTLPDGEGTNDFAHIVVVDMASGKIESTIQMTCNGEPIKGLLCANNVGSDSYNNLWLCGYVANTYNLAATNPGPTPLKIYHVDNLAAGTCTEVASLVLPEEESDAWDRIDYVDVVGDITREKSRAVVMSAASNGAGNNFLIVYGWQCEQGSDEWTGHMNGGEYVSAKATETYPADKDNWGTAPCAYMVRDEEHTGDLVYIDGFTTCPSLYDNEMAMITSFAEAVDLAPQVNTNGVAEFKLAGKSFVSYSNDQYVEGQGCQVAIAQLGDGDSFDGLNRYWLVPENGLGATSDGGIRYHSISIKDLPNNDKEGIYLVSYKCNNGMAAYAIAEEGWVDPIGGVNDIIADDVNAPVEYFNLQGVAVPANNLVPGLYITRQGNKTAKQVVK